MPAVGTSLLKKQLDKIVDWTRFSRGDVVELEKLGQLIKNTSHCGLGQTAANPILTTHWNATQSVMSSY